MKLIWLIALSIGMLRAIEIIDINKYGKNLFVASLENGVSIWVSKNKKGEINSVIFQHYGNKIKKRKAVEWYMDLKNEYAKRRSQNIEKKN